MKDVWYLLMPIDDVNSQGQKNTDALKSVGLLLMSSMECFAVKMRENVTHNEIILHDLIPKLKAPLHGRHFNKREDIANAVRLALTSSKLRGSAVKNGKEHYTHVLHLPQPVQLAPGYQTELELVGQECSSSQPLHSREHARFLSDQDAGRISVTTLYYVIYNVTLRKPAVTGFPCESSRQQSKMEWGLYEDRIAVLALHRCGKRAKEIATTLKPIESLHCSGMRLQVKCNEQVVESLAKWSRHVLRTNSIQQLFLIYMLAKSVSSTVIRLIANSSIQSQMAINRKEHRGLILDPTVRMEENSEQALRVSEEQEAIYRPCIPHFSESYNLLLDAWDDKGLLFGVRGVGTNITIWFWSFALLSTIATCITFSRKESAKDYDFVVQVIKLLLVSLSA
ncbi:hypothetical protein C0J52_18805 [Blattella germanica]|nr:hypothetical protein C0J52_18805 [Blattella germanica]